jgi:NTP pyrophosphatase (non-canonical NTP hydrolase)
MENKFIQILLQYEIRSSWWASYISNPYLQDLSGKYFAWKVIRKYKRYTESIKIQNELIKKMKIIDKVIKWGNERGLIKKENSYPQFAKIVEEVAEIGSALNHKSEAELIDAIGDSTVTLILLAAQNDLDFIKCLEVVYEEIKNRKGETVGGVFIKENFVLPEKWCIKRNIKNHRVVNEYFQKLQGHVHIYDSKTDWVYSQPNQIYSHSHFLPDSLTKPAGKEFTPITFEQFKKYVLCLE